MGHTQDEQITLRYQIILWDNLRILSYKRIGREHLSRVKAKKLL